MVVPTHNRPALLVEAMGSLAEQTVDDYEVVVVDDASTVAVQLDALRKILGLKVSLVRHDTSLGPGDARNSGVRASRGTLLAFLDDDDVYSPGYLERAIELFETHQELDVVFMGVKFFGAHRDFAEAQYREAMSRTLEKARPTRIGPELLGFGPDLVGALLCSVPMAFQRPVVRREAFMRLGGISTAREFELCHFAILAAARSCVALNTEALYLQRVDGQNYSSIGREFEHLLANIDMKEDLLTRLGANTAAPGQIRLLRKAVADGWFSLAYYAVRRCTPRVAWSAWMTVCEEDRGWATSSSCSLYWLALLGG